MHITTITILYKLKNTNSKKIMKKKIKTYAESKTLTDRVEFCLRNYPETRDSDITLTIKIWKMFYLLFLRQDGNLNYMVPLESLFELPREDNVKRVRAQFNSKGQYYPTNWRVAEARGIKEDDWRVALGYPTKQMTIIPTKSESYMDPQREAVETQNRLL